MTYITSAEKIFKNYRRRGIVRPPEGEPLQLWIGMVLDSERDQRISPQLLKEYFKRELSETYFGADKERFGRKISQRGEDRRENTSFATAILHTISTIKLPPP